MEIKIVICTKTHEWSVVKKRKKKITLETFFFLNNRWAPVIVTFWQLDLKQL